MKYYCKNCGCTVDVSPIELWNGEPLNPDCPFCTSGKKLVAIPAFETVSQWEARTGREYPDTAAIYAYSTQRERWLLFTFEGLFGNSKAVKKSLVVVATEAGAPPDDWKPEEEK